jgi:hypothetical protein
MSATIPTTVFDANDVVIQNYQVLKNLKTGSHKLVVSHYPGTPAEKLLVLRDGYVWARDCDANGRDFGFAPVEINTAAFEVVGSKVVTA